jgi:hypothetical protein
MCPEQYDLTDATADQPAYDPGNRLAYFRLRGGYFYVAVPDVGGEVVYEKAWDDHEDCYKGCFDNADERREHLAAGIAAALAWHGLTGDVDKLAAIDWTGCYDAVVQA